MENKMANRIRYYLIPAVLPQSYDPAKNGRPNSTQGLSPEPTIFDIMKAIAAHPPQGVGGPSLQGELPVELLPVDGVRAFDKFFYIIRIYADDFSTVDNHIPDPSIPKPVHITRPKTVGDIITLTGMGFRSALWTLQTPAAEVEAEYVFWLTGVEGQTLGATFGRPFENIENTSL